MISKKRSFARLSLSMVLIALLLITGAGFYRDLLANNEETYKGLKIFADVIEEINNNYVEDVDTADLIQEAIQGMVQSLDPHSQFLPKESFKELQSGTKGEFQGVGIVITMPKNILRVISPIENTPAYRAGLKAGDIIIKIDGEATKDLKIWEAVKKIRGAKGTKVVLTIYRKGVDEPLDFELVRDSIPVESVRHIVLKSGYGYIRVYNFTDKTTHDLKKALEELESDKIPLKGLILDLRNNPGGLLNQAINVSDLFLEDGIILSIKGRLEKHEQIFRAHSGNGKRKYPIVALINGGSASASEIVAGALQDHKRALILGTTSFGKGSVQTVKPLSDGSGIKYTIARYYTPSGRSIQAKGIEPDLEVKLIFKKEEAEDEENEDFDYDNYLKEKDLKNHLEAESKNQDKQKSEADEDIKARENKKDKDVPDLENTKYGELKADNLLKDNQVNRAYEILVSYDIFKTL